MNAVFFFFHCIILFALPYFLAPSPVDDEVKLLSSLTLAGNKSQTLSKPVSNLPLQLNPFLNQESLSLKCQPSPPSNPWGCVGERRLS